MTRSASSTHEFRQITNPESSGETTRKAIQAAVIQENYLEVTKLLMSYEQKFTIENQDMHSWRSFLSVSTLDNLYDLVVNQSSVLNLHFLLNNKKEAYLAYAHLIQNLQSLVVVGIDALYIETDVIEILLQALSQQNHVKTFEMNNMSTFTPKMIDSLAVLLGIENSTLTCLILQGKNDIPLPLVVQAIQKNQAITDLSLQGILSETEVIEIVTLMAQRPKWKSLTLSQNVMTNSVASALKTALIQNHTLEDLELKNMSITSEQASEIVNGLLSKESIGGLKRIDFSENKVDSATLALFDKLKEKYPLLEVSKPSLEKT